MSFSLLSLLLLLVLTDVTVLDAQVLPLPEEKAPEERSTSGDTIETSDAPYPWADNWIIGAGIGDPLGMRIEIGYRIQEYVTIGTTFGLFDTWSGEGATHGQLGVFGLVSVPIDERIVPYALIGVGGKLGLDWLDTYSIYAAGLLYPLTDHLSLRPEIGLVRTTEIRLLAEGEPHPDDLSLPWYDLRVSRLHLHIGLELNL